MSDPWDHETYQHEAFCESLANGAPIAMALRRGKLPGSTFRAWVAVAEGRAERLLTEDEREAFTEWLSHIDEAKEDGKGAREELAIHHATHDPATARWLLARLDPENYADLGRRRNRAAERAMTEAEERTKQAEAREAEARARIRELELLLAEAKTAAALDSGDYGAE